MMERYLLSLTYRDGVNRDSVVQFYTTKALANAYAADPTSAAATPLAELITATDDLTDAVRVATQVSRIDTLDTIPAIADNILRGNRIAASYRAGGRQFIITIPARKASAYVQSPNSLEVDPSAGAFNTWRLALQAAGRSINNDTLTVTRAYIVD